MSQKLLVEPRFDADFGAVRGNRTTAGLRAAKRQNIVLNRVSRGRADALREFGVEVAQLDVTDADSGTYWGVQGELVPW